MKIIQTKIINMKTNIIHIKELTEAQYFELLNENIERKVPLKIFKLKEREL